MIYALEDCYGFLQMIGNATEIVNHYGGSVIEVQQAYIAREKYKGMFIRKATSWEIKEMGRNYIYKKPDTSKLQNDVICSSGRQLTRKRR